MGAAQLLHPAVARLSRLRPAGLTILIYHRVLPQPDPLQPEVPDVVEFAQQMRVLSECFTPLSLADSLACLERGTLPDDAVTVTFDDGYADNLLHALPILQQYQVPATVFVASGFLDGGLMFNDQVVESVRLLPDGQYRLNTLGELEFSLGGTSDRRAAIAKLQQCIKRLSPAARIPVLEELSAGINQLPDTLMLTSAQLRELHGAGVEIGGHTRWHPILATLDAAQAQQEIESGKHDLEQRLDCALRFFAYPNGRPVEDFRDEHAVMVRDAGYQAAVTTLRGCVQGESDNYQLPRFTPWDKSYTRFWARLWQNRLGLM